jgi:hypothetical protein
VAAVGPGAVDHNLHVRQIRPVVLIELAVFELETAVLEGRGEGAVEGYVEVIAFVGRTSSGQSCITSKHLPGKYTGGRHFRTMALPKRRRSLPSLPPAALKVYSE